jgi:hypothetical protein
MKRALVFLLNRLGVRARPLCMNCRYWRGDDVEEEDNGGAGSCRRELPKVVTTQNAGAVIGGRTHGGGIVVNSFWPPVEGSQFCGSHRWSWRR